MARDRFDPQMRERFLACETVDGVTRVARDAGLRLEDGEVAAIVLGVQELR